MANPASSADVRSEVPDLWIDKLPLDICVRIASVVKTSDYVSALHLLPVSPTQCEAVKQVFAYRIDLSESFTPHRHRDEAIDCIGMLGTSNINGVPMLRNEAREIYVPGFRLYDPFYQPYYLIPSLRKIVIDDLPKGQGFDLPPLGGTIREMEIQLTNCIAITQLLQSISNPNLRKLTIVTSKHTCLHRILATNPRHQPLLATWFPNVEQLHLQCDRCPRRKEDPPALLWRVIERFSKLTHLTLTENVPEEAIEKLRRLKSVALFGDVVSVAGNNLFDLLGKIPDRVVRVVTSRSWCKGSPTMYTLYEDRFQLFSYSECTRLESLDCCIKPGSEHRLAPIVKNLRYLGLSFEWGAVNGSCHVLNPEKGALLNALSGAPFLKSIRLVNMRIARDELRQIMVHLGSQLEEFREQVIAGSRIDTLMASFMLFHPDTSLGEHEVSELIATLRTAALHNPSLRRFNIDTPKSRGMLLLRHDFVSSQTTELEQVLRLLERRAPHLDMDELLHDNRDTDTLYSCEVWGA